ncbi:hypothetical protein L195_g047872, partial [Trifolium pratense]
GYVLPLLFQREREEKFTLSDITVVSAVVTGGGGAAAR